jgi:hypothetical protein
LFLSFWSNTNGDDGIGNCEFVAAGVEEDIRAY